MGNCQKVESRKPGEPVRPPLAKARSQDAGTLSEQLQVLKRGNPSFSFLDQCELLTEIRVALIFEDRDPPFMRAL